MDPLMRRALFTGLLGGLAGIHVGLVGMIESFQSRDTIAGVITLGSMLPVLILLLVGWRAASPMRSAELTPTGAGALALGALASATGGLILAAFALFITVVDVRWILVNATPGLVEILQFGQGPIVGSLLLIVGGAVIGLAGASLNVLPSPIARSLAIAFIVTLSVSLLEPFLGPVLRNLGLDALEDFFFASGGLTPIGAVIVFGLTAADSVCMGDPWRARARAGGGHAGRPPPQRQADLVCASCSCSCWPFPSWSGSDSPKWSAPSASTSCSAWA